MLTWPDFLPPIQNNLSIASEAVDTRSKVTEALLNQRHRYDGQTVSVKVSWLMTDSQFGGFATLHKNGLNGGSDWFLMWLPVSDDADELHQVRFQDGQFSSAYQEGARWLVTATLDVLQLLNTPTEDDYDALETELSSIVTDDGTPVAVVDGQGDDTPEHANDVLTVLYRQD